MRMLSKCVILALLAMALLTLTAAAAEIGTGVVDADSLRMRSEPSTEAATVTYLTQDTKVSVQQKLDDWYQVSCGDYSGYVAAEFLRFTPAASTGDTTSTTSVVSQRAAVTAAPLAVITGSGVNLRPTASIEEEALAILDRGAIVTPIEPGEDWCKVSYDGQMGYVNADYINLDGLTSETGRITGDCVNVRDVPSTDGGIVAKVYAGSTVDLISRMEGWYKVSCDGVEGYVCDDYLREAVPGEASAIGYDIVAKAQEYLGTRYSYGGASPSGFDCSGFTMYIFGQFGYSLPHSATSQWNSSGEYVDRSDLQAGDLVLFCDPSRSNGKACSHVGIYISDGNFIHSSSSSSGGVIISNLDSGYYNTYYKGAKRVG